MHMHMYMYIGMTPLPTSIGMRVRYISSDQHALADTLMGLGSTAYDHDGSVKRT